MNEDEDEIPVRGLARVAITATSSAERAPSAASSTSSSTSTKNESTAGGLTQGTPTTLTILRLGTVYGEGDRVDHAQLSWPPGGGVMLGSARDADEHDSWPVPPGSCGRKPPHFHDHGGSAPHGAADPP